MKIKVKCFNGNQMIVSNPKRVKFWKGLIDNGKLPRCEYKVVE